MSAEKAPIYLILGTKTHTYGYEILTLRVVTHKIRNMRQDHEYDNLVFHAQRNIDRENDDGKFYAASIEYKDILTVNLDMAQRMVKVLRRINRAMDKFNNEWGYTENMGQLAIRFARAVKAQGWYESENSTSYDSWVKGARAIADLPWFISRLEEKEN
jgi:hypothetical protein